MSDFTPEQRAAARAALSALKAWLDDLLQRVDDLARSASSRPDAGGEHHSFGASPPPAARRK